MKILLTEEQTERLFIMLKEIIPWKYPYPRINDNQFVYNKGLLGTNEFIHWFELSWSILNEMLTKYEKFPNDIIKMKIYGMICLNKSSKINPVDWLYNTYLNYKENENI